MTAPIGKGLVVADCQNSHRGLIVEYGEDLDFRLRAARTMV